MDSHVLRYFNHKLKTKEKDKLLYLALKQLGLID